MSDFLQANFESSLIKHLSKELYVPSKTIKKALNSYEKEGEKKAEGFVEGSPEDRLNQLRKTLYQANLNFEDAFEVFSDVYGFLIYDYGPTEDMFGDLEGEKPEKEGETKPETTRRGALRLSPKNRLNQLQRILYQTNLKFEDAFEVFSDVYGFLISDYGPTNDVFEDLKGEKPEKKGETTPGDLRFNHFVNGEFVEGLPIIRVAGKARGCPYPKLKNYVVIPAWSRGAGEWKKLSPFFIGPIEYKDSGGEISKAKIFENFWQGQKVYTQIEKQNQKKNEWVWPKTRQMDKNQNPNDSWYKWNAALMKHKKAVRRPAGKAIPKYAYWEGEKLGIIESRKRIYIPYYQKLIRKSPVYKKLLKMVKSGKNIIIVEPDGPDIRLFPDGKEVYGNLLEEWIEVTDRKEVDETEDGKSRYRAYGHGFVIAQTLIEDLLWE